MAATVPALSDAQATLCIFLILMVPLAIGGLALMNTGFVRSRSAAHAMLSTLCAVAVAAIVYFAVGFAIEGYAGRPMHAISIGGKPWNWLGAERLFFRGLELDLSPASLAALLQLFGEAFAHRCLGGNILARPETVDVRPAADMLPDHLREAAGFILLDVEPQPRATDRRLNFGAAAHDAFVTQQTRDLPLAISRDFLRLEAVESATEIVALSQDRDP